MFSEDNENQEVEDSKEVSERERIEDLLRQIEEEERTIAREKYSSQNKEDMGEEEPVKKEVVPIVEPDSPINKAEDELDQVLKSIQNEPNPSDIKRKLEKEEEPEFTSETTDSMDSSEEYPFLTLEESEDIDSLSAGKFGSFEYGQPLEEDKVDMMDVVEIHSQADLEEYLGLLLQNSDEISLKSFLVGDDNPPMAKKINENILINKKASEMIYRSVLNLKKEGLDYLSKEILEFICHSTIDVTNSNQSIHVLINEFYRQDSIKIKEISNAVIAKEQLLIRLIDHVK